MNKGEDVQQHDERYSQHELYNERKSMRKLEEREAFCNGISI